ncbi:DUF3419 domain-containing protein [Verrucomicrobia bacterium LW23]|nr:DUF3419 domain-containing protein [Verrucomicrobia bacterium LW23]
MSTLPAPPAEAAAHARFDLIRYAQVWEDADVLLEGLNAGPGDECLSIASAGDNALAMLATGAQRVIALDLSAAQLACLALRVAAFRTLTHSQLLVLVGVEALDLSPGERKHLAMERQRLYQSCRAELEPSSREFWDARPSDIAAGIGRSGKFERYFHLFRTQVLPLVHSQANVRELFVPRDHRQREVFYAQRFNTWRWRLLFRLFFSRTVMGWAGRDPSFFRYVDGYVSVSQRVLERSRYAATVLDPSQNPYMQWIMLGTHTTALPYWLRPENFEAIRRNLGRLEWHQSSIESYLAQHQGDPISRLNLSDIFEYMSQENTNSLLATIARVAKPGARLVYWNMLAPRCTPPEMHHLIRPVGGGLSASLHAKDKAFFYNALHVEEVLGP